MRRMAFLVPDPWGNQRFIRKVNPARLAQVIGDIPTSCGLMQKNGRWFKPLGKDRGLAESEVARLTTETDELLRLAALGDLPRLSPEQVREYAEECRRLNVAPHYMLRLGLKEFLADSKAYCQNGLITFHRANGQDFFFGSPDGEQLQPRFPVEGENYQKIVAEIDGFFQERTTHFHAEKPQEPPAPALSAHPGTGRKLTLTEATDEYLEKKIAKPGAKRNIRLACLEVAAFVEARKLDWQSPTFNRAIIVQFRYEVMPYRQSPRAKTGPTEATIKAKLSHITNFWRWAMQRNLVTVPDHWDGHASPWDHLVADQKQIDAGRKKFREPFSPDQIVKLFQAEPAGSDLGDAMRICFTNGVRREEVTGLDASNIFENGRYYRVTEKIGKTENAARIVPLIGIAREIIERRCKAVNGKGPLFPDLPLDEIGKRGSVITQRFTRLRRRVLGEETDNSLDLHAMRGTWRTAAERSGVAHRTRARLSGGSLRDPNRKARTIVEELGGWAVDSDLPYDHGPEIDASEEAQRAIYNWLVKQGYLG
jgi:integrase